MNPLSGASRPNLTFNAGFISPAPDPYTLQHPVHVTARQFAQRLIPAHLENSPLEGQNLLESSNYWLEVISFFRKEGERGFLETGISENHWEHLQRHVLDYVTLIESIRSLEAHEDQAGKQSDSVLEMLQASTKAASFIPFGYASRPDNIESIRPHKDYQDKAGKLLDLVQEKLLSNSKSIVYIPFGYVSGPNNQGHLLTLKVRQYRDKLELLYLNLGEGLEFHPQLAWESNQPLFHFHSFPVHVDPSLFFGSRGQDLFVRLLRLNHEAPSSDTAPYSAIDCYGPLWELGNIQKTFDSKLADRAEPPQIWSVCADMGPFLLIKDLLIDLGYSRKAIERFFLNERQLAQMSFPARGYEEAFLLKKGAVQFAVDLVQASEKGMIDEEELNSMQEMNRAMASRAKLEMKQHKVVDYAAPPLKADHPREFILSHFEAVTPSISLPTNAAEALQQRYEKPSLELPPPEQFLEKLNRVNAYLATQKDPVQAALFVHLFLLSLPIPDPEFEGYWNALRVEEIPATVKALQKCVQFPDIPNGKHLAIITLHTAYAIADKLVRRLPEMKLSGFCSPFKAGYFEEERLSIFTMPFLTPHIVEKNYPLEFELIPMKRANAHWIAIRRYFQAQAVKGNPTLFGLNLLHMTSNFDIVEGVKNLQKSGWLGKKTITPSEQHLHYLMQFLSKKQLNNEFLLLEELKRLLVNRDGEALPPVFEPFYSLAFNAWCASEYNPSEVKDVVREDFSPSGLCISTYSEGLLAELPKLIDWSKSSILRLKRNKNNSQDRLYENDALCLEANGPLSKKWTQEWSRIAVNSEVRVSSIIQWMRTNLVHLIPEVHTLIESGLFEPGLLQNKIETEPSILKQLRILLEQGLDYYLRQDNLDNILFFCRISTLLESYAPETDCRRLQKIEATLLELAEADPSYEVCNHLLLLYSLSLPRDKESAAQLVRFRFLLKYRVDAGEIAQPWVNAEGQLAHHLYAKELQRWFLDPIWREKVVRAALQCVSIKSLPSEQEGAANFPVIEWGEYRVNINTLVISKKSGAVLLKPEVKEPGLIESNDVLWSEEGQELVSLNEGMKFEKGEDETYTTWELKEFGEFEEQWSVRGKIFFETGGIEHKVAWKWETQGMTHYLLDNQLLLKATPEGYRIHQLRDGRETGLLLSDSVYFQRLNPSKNLFCWLNPESEEIEDIEIQELGLSFKLEKNGGYRSFQYPDYILAKEYSLKELNGYEGGLILTNGKERCLLLPAKELVADNMFCSTVRPNTKFLFDKKPYFLFKVDPYDRLLVSDEPLANLYLTLLFAKQRDYRKALCYLGKSAAFEAFYHGQGQTLLRQFQQLKDESPEALAFYLRIGLHFIENATQPILPHYKSDGQRERLMSEFLQWVAKMYKGYLPLLPLKVACPIPQYIRLTHDEERRLQANLKPVLKKEELKLTEKFVSPLGFNKEEAGWIQSVIETVAPLSTHWTQVLDIRERLLENSGSIVSWIPPCTYQARLLTFPYLFSIDDLEVELRFFNIEKAPEEVIAPVRFNRATLSTNFITLYNRARKEEGELDLFYILRSYLGRDDGRILLAMGALLFHVGRNPQAFSDLNFEENQNESQLFIEVVERANTYHTNQVRVTQTVKSFAQTQLIFPRLHQTNIQLPPHPSLKPLSWKISEQETKTMRTFSKEIYAHFLDQDLELNWVASPTPETPAALSAFNPVTYSEHEILRILEKGYLEPRKRAVYRLKVHSSLEQCLEKAESLLLAKEEELEHLKTESERLANALAHADPILRLRQRGMDLQKITIHGILTDAYLVKNPNLIREANPTLSPASIQQLLLNTIRYHLIRIQINQLKQALEAQNIQSFGEALAVTHSLCPVQYPEITLFQSRSGKILWKEQTELFEWFFSTVRRHPLMIMAAPAGIGKTTTLQPIIMQWLSRHQLFPVSVSPTPLYLVDREGLRGSSQQLYNLQIAVTELALNTNVSAEDFKKVYEKLVHYQEKKGLKIVPGTYMALLLKYELALESDNLEAVRWCSLILDLLEQACGVTDECRANLSPFTQAEIGIGKPSTLPKVDRKVFIEIYRVLTSPNLKDRVGLQENLQAVLEPQLNPSVKKEACRLLLEVPFFAISPKDREAVYAYWMGNGSEPECTTREIDLVKVYFTTFFEAAMTTVGKMQHLRSSKPDEEIHVPARKKQPTNAYFKEVYATLITTIQGLLQEGLDKQQGRLLLKLLYRKHREEMQADLGISTIERELQRWVRREEARLTDYVNQNGERVGAFLRDLDRHPDAIFYYLEHHVLKQVTYCPERLVVNPIHFLNAFSRNILLSADPGPQEIYTLFDNSEAILTDSAFLSDVVERLAAEENSDLVSFPPLRRPLELFEWLNHHNPRILQDLSMVIDAGGALRDFSLLQIKDDFFTFMEKSSLNYDGIILFEEPRDVKDSSKLLLFLGDGSEPKELKGNDLDEAFAAHGLNQENLKLLTLIDPSHSTGANIKQPPNAHGLLLIGEDLSLGDLIQGVMRLRGFIKKQTITWGISQPLAQKVERESSRPIDPKTLTYWTAQNEATRRDKEMLLSADHQITYLIEYEARRELKSHLHNPWLQIATWKKHRAGFVSTYTWDPIERFKEKGEEKPAKEPLLEYAREHYARFKYRSSFKKFEGQLAPILEAVSRRTPTLPQADGFEMAKETEMHTHQIQKLDQDQLTEGHTDLQPLPSQPLPDSLQLNMPSFTTQLAQYVRPSRDVYGSRHLTNRLFLTNNLIRTAQTGRRALGIDYLKPPQYFLLIEEEKSWKAFALSDEEAVFFQKQLLSIEVSNRRAALLNADGTIAQNGREEAAFPQSISSHPFVQDCVIDLGLMRCQLTHPERFLERVEGWEDFWPMWKKMKAGYPYQRELNPGPIERLVPKAIEKQPTPSQKKGWFSRLFSKEMT